MTFYIAILALGRLMNVFYISRAVVLYPQGAISGEFVVNEDPEEISDVSTASFLY